MFTFLGWFFIVLIVLTVLAVIGYGVLQAYCYVKAWSSPSVQSELRRMELSNKRMSEINRRRDDLDYLKEMDLLNTLENALRENRRTSREKNNRPSGPVDAYVRNPDGSSTKLKQVF